jgi:hypothetical protein
MVDLVRRVLSAALIGAAAVFVSAARASAADNKTGPANLAFNETDVVYLQLTRSLPINVTLYSIANDTKTARLRLKNVIGYVELGNSAVKTSADYTNANKTELAFHIDFDDVTDATKFAGNVTDKVTLQQVKITLTMKTYGYGASNASVYWEVSQLNVSYKAEYTKANDSEKITVDNEDTMLIKRGYTTIIADRACTRGYGICAALGLCWTCWDEVRVSDLEALQRTANDTGIRIEFPGLRLQPIFGNYKSNTTFSFGYDWDCDPILSIGLWVGLLLSLGLIIIVGWGIDMISGLNTPDKFDDPKGKPINVPQAD